MKEHNRAKETQLLLKPQWTSERPKHKIIRGSCNASSQFSRVKQNMRTG